MTMPHNSSGNPVSGFPELRKKEYWSGEFDAGDPRRPKPDFERWLVHADGNGFDVTREILPGAYQVHITLPVGTHIIRYGSPFGFYSAPYGTRFEELSLAWKEDSCEYHEYIVQKEALGVYCLVMKGYVAPGFEMPGGGIQFYHDVSIHRSLEDDVLGEVY